MSEVGDYANALRSAYSIVPTYGDLKLQALQADQAKANILQTQAQTGLFQQQAQAAQTAAQRQQTFQEAVRRLGDSKDPYAYRQLATEYPEFAKPLSDAAAGITDTIRSHKSAQFSQIENAIRSGKPQYAAQMIQREIDADKAAGNDPDPDDVEMLRLLRSSDPKDQQYARGVALASLRALNPDTVGKNVGDDAGDFTLSSGERRYDAQGNLIAQAPFAPQYREVGPGQTLVEVGGGDPASGGVAGGQGDTSRLINSDAGGGYVPDSVQTLGQFVSFGKALNRQGAKSSSAGTYQINGSTMLEFAPKALGSGWATAPFDASSQEKVGEAIFEWAKRQPNPAAALRGRWVSLTAGEAATLVKGNWSDARSLIARKESGGGPGASATPQVGGARVIARGAPKEKDAPAGYRWTTNGQLEAIPGGPGDKRYGGDRKAEADFRKEFEGLPEVKTFISARPQFQSLRTLATKPNPTAQDDIALIFNFMKTLDPASVVREGEFATAQNAGGIPDNIRNLYNRAQQGTRLNAGQRRAMLQTAFVAYKAQREAYNGAAERYRGYAKDSGVNPDRVARTYTPVTAKVAPKLGQVVKGYRYKGGNPALPSSWVKAQ